MEKINMILEKEFTNWRRYILVGSKNDIEKYLEEQPISETHIVHRSSMINLVVNYKTNNYPDCVRGITLQNTDIILINVKDCVYKYFKRKTKEDMKIYPSPNMNPRIYKVEV